MKTPLTVLFFFLFCALSAQDMPSTFSVYGGGGIGYRSVNLSWPNSEAVSSSRDESEHPGFSWSSGFSVGQQLAPRLWFRTGARLVNTTYRTDVRSSIGIRSPFSGFDFSNAFGFNSDPTLGNISVGSFCDFGGGLCVIGSQQTREVVNEVYTNFRQVEIPFIFRYELNEQRLKPYAEAGFAFNYLLFSRVYAVNDGRKGDVIDRKLDGPGRFGATALLALGASYGITSNIDVFAHPVMRYSVSKVSLSSGDLTERPLSLILEVGIRKTTFN